MVVFAGGTKSPSHLGANHSSHGSSEMEARRRAKKKKENKEKRKEESEGTSGQVESRR